MCGIAGYLGVGDKETLEKMTSVLGKRGPDDHGVYLNNAVGLAHTRLAIIDLSASGHQPMQSSTSNTVISFNGEIYNFPELRRELTATGNYRFTTETDTEIILALYETYGVEAFSRLNGMFAFALYDLQKEELILVRDRLGKKPLYWGIFNNTLVFGSELKALMCHKDFKKEIDPRAVELFLAYECVPTPFSIFKGVHKLKPGSYLVCKNGIEPKEHIFWDIPRASSDISFSDAVAKLDNLLEASVARRLLSDVPLGVFLSGGLDSSTVAYYATKVSSERVKTFSIGFTNSDFDESPYADIVAKHLGVSHTVEHFSAERCMDLIPEIFSYLDEPMADPSLMPTYLLSQFTRKHVTVALAGDGSDELFAGYPTFKAEPFVNSYKHIPQIIRHKLIEPLINSLPVKHSYFSLDFKLKRFLEGVEADDRHRHQQWLGAFNDTEASEVLLHRQHDPVEHMSPYKLVDTYFPAGATRGQFLNDLLWSYARTYLMDEVLVKVDRASMAHGLEVRAPFLDYTLVEFVQSLPYKYKFHLGTGKYIVKRLMEDKLPREIVYRKKRGFGIPIGPWLRDELKPLSNELLSRHAIEKSGLFDPAVVERIKTEHENGVRDNRKKLWTLMVFQLWFNNWGQ
jgi:asparagine synthase (glutamine-hydrolysing)